MRRILLRGRVLPEKWNVTIPTMGPVLYDDPKGLAAEIGVKIVDGEVEVETTSIREPAEYSSMLVARSLECVNSIVDLYAFCNGVALHVMLDSMVEDGVIRHFAFSEMRVLRAFDGVSNIDALMPLWREIAFEDLDVRLAFHDLAMSLRTLNYSSIAAARVIDAVRNKIAPAGGSLASSWELLRKNLNVSKAYLQTISDASKLPRHGVRGLMEGDIQVEILTRAWTMMFRYLEFRRRGGSDPLPPDVFPFLDSHEQKECLR